MPLKAPSNGVPDLDDTSSESGAWHRDRFAEFVRLKALVGEPSPHMTIVGWMARGLPRLEIAWRGGCYLVPYSVLSAEAIWSEWNYARAIDDPDGLTCWIKENWQGIHTRTERRCVRTPASFAKSLTGYAAWLRDVFPNMPAYAPPSSAPEAKYDYYWKNTITLPYFGRYITIRLLEYLKRYTGLQAELYDIRSIGGWSPIKALMLLRPDEIPALETGQRKEVDRVAFQVLAEYSNADLVMSTYVFAALLCEYRVAWKNRAQYPGWTVDQELEYQDGKHAQYWRERGLETQLWEARTALFPEYALGEYSGWDKRRYDVAAVLRDYGYVWSDAIYNYSASQENLSQPVLRQL